MSDTQTVLQQQLSEAEAALADREEDCRGLREEVAALKARLQQAAEWFFEYEKIHRDKGADAKADRNRERGDACLAAVKEVKP
jgi:hypothetical protein